MSSFDSTFDFTNSIAVLTQISNEIALTLNEAETQKTLLESATAYKQIVGNTCQTLTDEISDLTTQQQMFYETLSEVSEVQSMQPSDKDIVYNFYTYVGGWVNKGDFAAKLLFNRSFFTGSTITSFLDDTTNTIDVKLGVAKVLFSQVQVDEDHIEPLIEVMMAFR